MAVTTMSESEFRRAYNVLGNNGQYDEDTNMCGILALYKNKPPKNAAYYRNMLERVVLERLAEFSGEFSPENCGDVVDSGIPNQMIQSSILGLFARSNHITLNLWVWSESMQQYKLHEYTNEECTSIVNVRLKGSHYESLTPIVVEDHFAVYEEEFTDDFIMCQQAIAEHDEAVRARRSVQDDAHMAQVAGIEEEIAEATREHNCAMANVIALLDADEHGKSLSFQRKAACFEQKLRVLKEQLQFALIA